jgi:hypothetical protein
MRDSDVLFLFDQAADGIEGLGEEVNRRFGVGEMRPGAWFEPLPGLSPRPDAED